MVLSLLYLSYLDDLSFLSFLSFLYLFSSLANPELLIGTQISKEHFPFIVVDFNDLQLNKRPLFVVIPSKN